MCQNFQACRNWTRCSLSRYPCLSRRDLLLPWSFCWSSWKPGTWLACSIRHNRTLNSTNHMTREWDYIIHNYCLGISDKLCPLHGLSPQSRLTRSYGKHKEYTVVCTITPPATHGDKDWEMAKLLSNGVDGLCIMIQSDTRPRLSAPNHRGRAHGRQAPWGTPRWTKLH